MPVVADQNANPDPGKDPERSLDHLAKTGLHGGALKGEIPVGGKAIHAPIIRAATVG
jgi:hypothetical protein